MIGRDIRPEIKKEEDGTWCKWGENWGWITDAASVMHQPVNRLKYGMTSEEGNWKRERVD